MTNYDLEISKITHLPVLRDRDELRSLALAVLAGGLEQKPRKVTIEHGKGFVSARRGELHKNKGNH